MKRICSIISSLLILFAAAAAAQNFAEVHPGVEFAQHDTIIAGKNVRMSLLRVGPAKVRIDVARAMGASIGVEKTSSIVERRGAVSAVNAGYFRFQRSIFAGYGVGFPMKV